MVGQPTVSHKIIPNCCNKLSLEKFNRNKLDFEQIKKLMQEMKTIQAKEWLLPLMYRQLNKLGLSLAQRLALINLYQIKSKKKQKSLKSQDSVCNF